MIKDLRLRTAFDNAAQQYDAARPNYPEELFDTLVAETHLCSGTSILEIGAGTGKATVPMASRGFAVTAIELGPALVQKTRENVKAYPNASVLEGAFEKVVLPESSFDLVYAATALHWIDPAFRFVKPHKLLKQGGYLAIIHTHHVSDDRGDAFSVAAKAIYKKYRDDYDPTFTLPSILNIKPLVVDQIDTKLFELTFFKAFPKQLYYSADEYIQLLGTFSDTIAMPDNNRVPFLQSIKSLIEDEFGGGIVKHFAMSLTVARKI